MKEIFQHSSFSVSSDPPLCHGSRYYRTFFLVKAMFFGVLAFSISCPISVARADSTETIQIDRSRLEGVADNSPLVRSGDKAAWDYLFERLGQYSPREIENAPAMQVGFIELDRQPVEYRGRLVKISGRLLRCEFIPLPKESGPFDHDEPEIAEKNDDKNNRSGFYKSWIQLEDRKDIPICVCSLRIPKGLSADGTDRNDPVSVTGFFYKKQLYLSDADEEVSTPTILAKTFRWKPVSVQDAAKTKGSQTKQGRSYFTASILTLLFLWICLRFLVPLLLSRKRSAREKIKFDLSGLKDEKKDGIKIADLKINVHDNRQDDQSDDSNDDSGLSSPEDDDFPTPSPGSDQTTVIPKVVPILSAFLLAGICSSVSAKHADIPDPAVDKTNAVKIDAKFTQDQLFQMDDLSWNALGDERVPWEQQRDEILAALDRLRRFVPYSFLKAGISGQYVPTGGATKTDNGLPLAADSGQFIGKAFELKGTILNVEEIELNPLERKLLEVPAIYRCRILVPGQGCADVLTRFVPAAWLSDQDRKQDKPRSQQQLAKQQLALNQFAVVYGIYIKRLSVEKDSAEVSEENAENKAGEKTETRTEATDSGKDEEIPLAIRSANDELLPLLIAPKVEWYPINSANHANSDAPTGPDSLDFHGFLGSIGFDVGSFDLIPSLRISDVKKKRFDELPPSLQLLSRNEIIQRAFKFTEADRDPFYGLLRAAKQTSSGRIEQEARRELKKEDKTFSSAVRLFNDPAGTRGKPVLLTGTAKRILSTLVEDKEVQKLYGIDKYYQIYLFTKDSQNNPLIVCVTSLPDGMPVGSDDKYAEQITVGAIPYKLWIYESSAKLEGPDGEVIGNKPAYAPLLIGRSVNWHPTKKHDRPLAGDLLPSGTASSISLGIFVALLALWIGLRRFRSDKPIEFKLRK